MRHHDPKKLARVLLTDLNVADSVSIHDSTRREKFAWVVGAVCGIAVASFFWWVRG